MIDKIVQLIGLLFFAFAVWLIGKEIEHIGVASLWHLILSTPLWVILLVLMMMVLDFAVLSGYDKLALDYIHHPLPFLRVLEASAIGFAISNTSGHAYASGGSVRYLFYLPQGLTRTEIVKVIVFETLTIFMGLAAVYLFAVALMPFEQTVNTVSYTRWLYWSAGGIAAFFVAYYVFWIRPHRDITVGQNVIPAPSKQMTLLQIMVGICDNIALFLAFYVALRYHLDAPVFETFMVFILAQCIGLATQVPGGIGVFEGTFLYLFPHTPEQKAGILAGLVLFRVLCYFVPLALAGIYLGVRWVRQRLKS